MLSSRSSLYGYLALALVAAGCSHQAPSRTAPSTTDEGATEPTEASTEIGAGREGTPIAASAAAAAEPSLTALAASDARGMRAEGGVFAAQLAEGEVLTIPFSVQPGACYAVVGAGVGIVRLDIQIVLQTPPLPPFVAATSTARGSNAVLGGRSEGCWRNPMPLAAPGQVILRATRGAGIAAAQIYIE